MVRLEPGEAGAWESLFAQVRTVTAVTGQPGGGGGGVRAFVVGCPCWGWSKGIQRETTIFYGGSPCFDIMYSFELPVLLRAHRFDELTITFAWESDSYVICWN